MEEQNESKSVSISDFIITQKVDAFHNTYVNTEDESTADNVFTDSKLRKYFHAYPLSMGDPLAEYINLLGNHGFKMQTSITGEPAIFVRLNRVKNNFALEDAFGKENEEGQNERHPSL
ncbi:hypothetical protein [Bacteroides sp.]|uniref:hypothetical protein n=1 Tax=Bacteroides sp. TaxID=29523 RepID=UPI00261F5E3E|nr:hypothetical protein [Bacteroides sp.]MDD3040911.1 hypothetical protein [Bacteroides sp.]